MPLYLGTEEAGTSSFALQDFLPTPVTFLKESHALDVASLVFGVLVVYALLHNHKHTKDRPIPKWARYLGMVFAIVLLASSHWLTIAYRWKLAEVLGAFIKSQLIPLYQSNSVWNSIGLIANITYWALLLGLIVYIWRARMSLGAGVLRLSHLFSAANERV
jgi:general stress protein CsbA